MIQKLNVEMNLKPYQDAGEAYNVACKFAVSFDDTNAEHNARLIELATAQAAIKIASRIKAGMGLPKGTKFAGTPEDWKAYIQSRQPKLSITDLFGKIERPVTVDSISSELARERMILDRIAAKKISRADAEKWYDAVMA